jgi:hypothetical protein
MIKESNPTSSSEDDFVRLDVDMTREVPQPEEFETQEDQQEEEEEPPMFSTVFAVDQLKQGAANAASLFSWGLQTVKTKAIEITESEQVKSVVESTKPQREALSAGASHLWETTRPQREEIARTASTLSEKAQPHLEKIKQESAKAIDSLSSVVNEVIGVPPNASSTGSSEQIKSGTSDDV